MDFVGNVSGFYFYIKSYSFKHCSSSGYANIQQSKNYLPAKEIWIY
jgi:hypothetical protein